MKNRDFSTVQSSKQIEKKVMKKAKKQWVVKGLLFSTILGSSLLLSNVETFAQEIQKEWKPRTSEQIKEEIKGNEYIIKWGDTLSAISVATDISINRLAEINQITNIDLIYAGNKLVFGGEINSKTGEDNRVVAVQDSKGKTSVVINTDENKPLVNQKETNKAKETENNGGTYTPPKTDNNGSKPLPEVPTVPKPKPEEPVPPVKPVDPVKPTDPEPPVDPVNPGKTEADKTQLTALYNSTIDYKSTDYEENSWLQFKNTRNEAKTVLDNKEATQSEIDNMTVKLQSAINGLVPIATPEIVDKTNLLNLVEEVKDYQESDYTTESWSVFYDSFVSGTDVLANESATQEEVDSAYKNLSQSISSLEKVKEVNKQDLIVLYDSTASLNPDDYTEKSYNDFILAKSDAKSVIDNPNATVDDVNKAQQSLQQAIDSLEKIVVVDKTKLIELYDSTASLNPDDYTEKSYNDFILAKSDAKSVIDNPKATDDEVNKAQQSLQQAIDSLEKVVIADKTKLIELYDSTASLNPNDYTEESWNSFIIVKADAKSVIDNPNATQEEADSINQLLLEKVENLEKKAEESDFSKLAEKTPTYSLSMTEKIEASINAFRIQNGEKSLPISQRSRELSDADAKQNVSDDYMNWSADHNENAIGTTFSIIGATNEDEAVQKAMTNWINSQGHHDAMLWDDNGDIGASVYVMKTTKNGTVIYTFEFIATMYPDWM
ncbi:LysM peptidoglycan-binding domain-containing protein [Vagococcus carniphilus]|uniref:LysM domain-containing protein n=1 Tax=Vagococcus carniphilus TaxID=218144 RepID=A0A430ARV1_9ENTE|nr:LysM peptidoglycan-binding domain-containing protein [Vagococcus carniphilus]QNN73274.1 FIVAR domain-containing protein [Vagococcus carniphilus]RSU10788.1 hypothetical protein CBF28_12875 [Vagococcus carniphilus]